MSASIYLFFDGNCEEAFRYYEAHLGAKIEALLPYGGTPAPDVVPADWSGKLAHARIRFGDVVVMASDAPPGRYSAPQGFRVSLAAATPEDARRKFAALAENGAIDMPLQETFFARRFGMTTDRFGIPWMVNCEGAATEPHQS